MPFELKTATEVTVTNVNPRRELHGEEKVRAIDISLSLSTDNHILDVIQEGLRAHHFTNHALDQKQVDLPDVLATLPNLRFPDLPRTYHFQKGVKLRGYRFIWDFGMQEEHVVFNDAVISGLQYEIYEGGAVEVKFTVQYNGDELNDNDLYGELSGLTAEGSIHVKLEAPVQPQVAKKGYRAGKPDTVPAQPAAPEGQMDLEGSDGEEEQDADPDDDQQAGAQVIPIGSTVPPLDSDFPQTPEEALARSVGAQVH